MRAHCLAAILAAAAYALPTAAAPVNVSFHITANEGNASGNFAGDDSNLDGKLSASELSRFEALASGTGFTGGPIAIGALEAVLISFSFDLASWLLSFEVINGQPIASSGYRSIACYSACGVGQSLSVARDNRGSLRRIDDFQLSVSSAVPEPGSLLLAGAALAALAAARRARAG